MKSNDLVLKEMRIFLRTEAQAQINVRSDKKSISLSMPLSSQIRSLPLML